MDRLLSRERCDPDGVEVDRLASVDAVAAGLAGDVRPKRQRFEFWDSDRARPDHTLASSTADTRHPFTAASKAYLAAGMAHPYLSRAEIESQQLARMRQLVAHAYDQVPVYRKKYHDAGFGPTDLKTYADIQKIPVITKPELIAAFPDQCLSSAYKREDLFPTRSSGSSGKTLLIRVDFDAIVAEAIQGLRQVALQSGLKYGEGDLLASIDTARWWYSSPADAYPTAFVSRTISPANAAQHLRVLAPRVLSLRPSALAALLPYAEAFRSSLYLVVTHSEYSAAKSRRLWSQRLGVPVLDEYRSDEATRIAFEFPSGRYHVCEDTVHLDVLDPDTLQPQVKGRSGLAVVTNLLNEAMPFIRYVQGDYVTQPADPEPCDVQWSQIASIDGRLNDVFLNRSGRRLRPAPGSV